MDRRDHSGSRRESGRRRDAAILPATDPRQRIVLISVLELTGLRRKRAISAALASLSHQETAVFVTDDLDFAPFVKRRLAYEFLPSLGQQASHRFLGTWDRYLVERLRILIDKWSPIRITSPGTAFERFVQKAHQ